MHKEIVYVALVNKVLAVTALGVPACQIQD